MSIIYSTKYMTEANTSTSLANKVLARPVNETYLFSALNILRKMNSVINENTKQLYIQIAEAESKQDENKLFANYYYQFKNIFDDFVNKLGQMKSRMIISVDNKIDTWEDLMKDDSYISSFDKELSFAGYEFFHMAENNYPRLHLSKIYQREFDYLGALMQDKGMNASPSDKLKIIASVTNNFTNNANSQQWTMDLVKEMIDIDEKEYSTSYSEQIYYALRDKHEYTVNRETLYTCKERLCDYQDVVDAAVRMCDNLLFELNKVAEDISSYLFRNQDNKLKIKTSTDGIIDRDYRLDTYSMNQLDIFMKDKVTQIRKVLNIFCVAIAIKFDTVVDYIDQNIKILQMAKRECENKELSKNDNVEDTSDDFDIPTGKLDDNTEDDFDADNFDDDNFEFYGDDDGKEPVNEEDPETDDVPDKDSQNFDESYIFESELFELELAYESYAMLEEVSELLSLNEAKKPSRAERKKENLKKAKEVENKAKEKLKKANQAIRKAREDFRNASAENKAAAEQKVKEAEAEEKRAEQEVKEAEANVRDTNAEAQDALNQANASAQNNTAQNNRNAQAQDAMQQANSTNTSSQNTSSGDQGQNSNNGNLSNLRNLKDKRGAWRKFLEKLAVLWKRFKEAVFNEKTRAKIDYLKKNYEYINTKITNRKIVIECKPNFTKLETLKIPDLNYTEMAPVLVSEDEFIKKYFNDYSDSEKSLSDMMKSKLLGEKQPETDIGSVSPTVIEAYNFCIKYQEKINNIKEQTDILEKAQSAAKKIENVQESYSSKGFEQYFNEMEDKTPQEQKEKNDEKKTTKEKSVDVYFKVCTQVLAAEMTIYTSIFNEMYSFCVWYIKEAAADKAAAPAANTVNDQQQQTQPADNQEDVKLN